MPVVAQESKLKMIKDTWVVNDIPDSKSNPSNTFMLALTIWKELTFKDNRRVITSVNLTNVLW